MSWVQKIHDRKFPGSKISDDRYGFYVIRSDETPYQYPKGVSSVLYIGEGKVGARIRDHAEGRGNPMVFGVVISGEALSVAWGSTPSKAHAVSAESALLTAFVDVFGALPVGNTAGPLTPKYPPPVWVWGGSEERRRDTKELLLLEPIGDATCDGLAKGREAKASISYKQDIANWYLKVRHGKAHEHPGWMREVFEMGRAELQVRKSAGDIVAAVELLYREPGDFQRAVIDLLGGWREG